MAHHKKIGILRGSTRKKKHKKSRRVKEHMKGGLNEVAVLQAYLQSLKFEYELLMAEMIGAKLYKQEDGFTQAQLYAYGGRNDSVFTLSLRKESEGYRRYGSQLTVCFIYTRDERKALEENTNSLDAESYIKAKLLVSREGQCDNTADILEKDGLNTRDIIQIIVLPSVDENNTFPSKEKRTPKVLEIPFEAEGNGDDIEWIYGFLERQKEDGVGLMPEDDAIYLAYKLILEREELTEDEKRQIFNAEGKIRNREVAYHYLLWKKEAGLIKNRELMLLNRLKQDRVYRRVALVDDTLKEMGLNIEEFAKKYPESASLLYKKIMRFHDRSFNTTGRYPLYMNFKSLLHIYFRHTNEMNVGGQYANRDKFQLEEHDVITVIDIVMHQLNDEYQAFKKDHPNGRFFRAGKMAYYYNGDYYHVDVNEDGSISTFYKASGNKK